MISELYRRLEKLAIDEFSDIIKASQILHSYTGRVKKLRLELIDDTFIDICYSVSGNYSFHWEQRPVREAVYRHDNAPHKRWKYIETYPKHCHDGTQENVTKSNLTDIPENAVKEFLTIIRKKLSQLEYE